MFNIHRLLFYFGLRAIGGGIAAILFYYLWDSVAIKHEKILPYIVSYAGFWTGWLASCSFFNDVSSWFD